MSIKQTTKGKKLNQMDEQLTIPNKKKVTPIGRDNM